MFLWGEEEEWSLWRRSLTTHQRTSSLSFQVYTGPWVDFQSQCSSRWATRTSRDHPAKCTLPHCMWQELRVSGDQVKVPQEWRDRRRSGLECGSDYCHWWGTGRRAWRVIVERWDWACSRSGWWREEDSGSIELESERGTWWQSGWACWWPIQEPANCWQLRWPYPAKDQGGGRGRRAALGLWASLVLEVRHLRLKLRLLLRMMSLEVWSSLKGERIEVFTWLMVIKGH